MSLSGHGVSKIHQRRSQIEPCARSMADSLPCHDHSHPVNHVTSLSAAAVALAHACQMPTHTVVQGTHKEPLDGSEALLAQLSPAS